MTTSRSPLMGGTERDRLGSVIGVIGSVIAPIGGRVTGGDRYARVVFAGPGRRPVIEFVIVGGGDVNGGCAATEASLVAVHADGQAVPDERLEAAASPL